MTTTKPRAMREGAGSSKIPYRDRFAFLYSKPRMHEAFAHTQHRGYAFNKLQDIGIGFMGRSVLEVGAGTGVNVGLMRRLGAARITALERDSATVRFARERLGLKDVRSGVVTASASGRRLKVNLLRNGRLSNVGGKHDVVISMWSFPQIARAIANDWMRQQGLKNDKDFRRLFSRASIQLFDAMYQRVRPGGNLIIGDYLPKEKTNFPVIELAKESIQRAIARHPELPARSQHVTVDQRFKAGGKDSRLVLEALEWLESKEDFRMFKNQEDIKRLLAQGKTVDVPANMHLFVITKPKPTR